MATKKPSATGGLFPDWRKQREEFLAKHPALQERFYVAEVTPASEDDYGGYISGSSRMVSDYLDTEAEAKEWIEGYDPAPGNHFIILHEFLREYNERRWTTY